MDHLVSCGPQQVSEKWKSNRSPLESHESACFVPLPCFEAPSTKLKTKGEINLVKPKYACNIISCRVLKHFENM